MPRRTERQRRAENLIKDFLGFCKARVRATSQRARRQRHFLRHTPITNDNLDDLNNDLEGLSDGSVMDVDLEADTLLEPALSASADSNPSTSSTGESHSSSSSIDISSDNDSDTFDDTSDTSDDDSDDIDSDTSSFTSFDSSDTNDDMPFLHPAGYPDSDDEDLDSDSDSDDEGESGSDMDSSEAGIDADIEDWDDEVELPPVGATQRLGRAIHTEISHMYEKRYLRPRTQFPRGPGSMRHLLNVLKTERPDHFRKELRVSPYTFDRLVARIIADPVFSNHSQNEQMPVEDQLAIALYRFGHYGNAAALDRVSTWSGYSKGTISLATRRVMTAILRKEFMDEAVSFPTAAEKEEAKCWVEKHSCEAWRDGWCMVDGTLVTLFNRPFWYGESYFDRKCNYSLNIQIVNMPNLRIVDYGYGFTGSTHDSTAWERTRTYEEHDTILEEGEFIWGDSAYPIEVWLVAPFKKPDSDLPDNETFNNHVSMVRIRSEHAIGFLKGRFQSLKGLRINIRDETSHKFATYWVVCTIGIHTFAMKCEQEERDICGNVDDVDDPFIAEGLSSSSSSESQQPLPPFQRCRPQEGTARA